MKAVIIADIHLSRYSQDSIESTSNLPMRLHGINQAFLNILKYCYDNLIKNVIILGDVLHTKSIIHSLAQSIMLDWFRNNKNIDFIIIDGNHDLSGKGSDAISALKSVDSESNVFRIPGSKYHDLDNDILYVPYSTEMVSVIKNSSAKYLMSHFGLSEGMLDSGISIKSEISMKDLRGKYENVFLGHYHKPQEIMEENIKLSYVGSLIQLDWGEKNQDKRFFDLDFEKNELKEILTNGYKKHVEFILDENTIDTEEIVKKANQMLELGHSVNLIKKSKNIQLNENLISNIKIIDRTEVDITNRGINQSMNEMDKFKKYLNIKNISEGEQEEYLKEAMILMEDIGDD